MSMSTRLSFVDRDGKHYGFLDDVDDTSVLSNIRIRAAKVCTDCKLPANFLFTLKNTPVALKQEAVLKVSRCAKVIAENPKVLEVVIMLTQKVAPVTENNEKNNKRETQPKENERFEFQTVSNMKCKLEKGTSPTLTLFTKDEIENGSISKLEKERMCFWNTLAPKISSHPRYKQWSLQAHKGIIDTEWILRKAELLKIEAEQVLKIVRTENDKNHKTAEEEKHICQNLDRMLKADFKRRETYKKIEDLHQQLKNPGSRNRSIEDEIKENETTLDKIITELKSTQNALEMTITRAKNRYAKGKETPLFGTDLPQLTDEETKEVSQSVMDDFEEEGLSD